MNCQASNETVMVASKKGTLACFFFYKLSQVPTLIKIEGMAHNFLTTKSHSRSIIQLDHPF